MKMLPIATIGVVLLGGSSTTISGQRNGTGGAGQNPIQNSQPMPGRGNIGFPPMDGRDPAIDPMGPRLEEQQIKTRNNERQKKLVADAARLLALAEDLKQQVDKTSKDAPSGDVVRKAEEIEKLAKSVKDKMKG
jgi:hypothetical protein